MRSTRQALDTVKQSGQARKDGQKENQQNTERPKRKIPPPFSAPDALLITGRARQRNFAKNPKTGLSFMEALRHGGHLHVVYRAIDDNVASNCHHPELLLRTHASVRAAFTDIGPDSQSYPVLAAVERGWGSHPLHLHLLCGVGTPLPETIKAGDLATFIRVPWAQTVRRKKLIEDILYLMKEGDRRGNVFKSSLHPDDPGQPDDFQQAKRALEDARQLSQHMGRERLPKRRFYINVPRLTDAQVEAICRYLATAPTAASSMTWKEFEKQLKMRKFSRGAQSEGAKRRLYHGLNILLLANAENLALLAAYKNYTSELTVAKREQVPTYSTVTRYAASWGKDLKETATYLQLARSARADSTAALLLAIRS